MHGVIEVLYQSDIRKIFSHKIQLAGTILIAATTAMAFRNDWFGYDTYVPKIDKIESAAISINGLEQSNFYAFENLNGESDIISSLAYQMEKMNLTGEMIPVVHQLMSLGAERSKSDEPLENGADFYLKVRLKGGREVMRCYTVSLEQAYDLFCTVFQSREYKEKSYAYFLENLSQVNKVQIRGLSSNWQEISKEESMAFLEIYQKELMEVCLDDIRDYPVIGLLDCDILKWRRDTTLSLLPTMKESLAYLEKIGILESNAYWVHPLAENVLSLQITRVYVVGTSDETGEDDIVQDKTIEVTEEELIEKLCQKLYFSNGWSSSLFWGNMYDNSGYEFYIVLKPEVAQRYFNREEYKLRAVIRDFDDETAVLLEKLMQEYNEMK